MDVRNVYIIFICYFISLEAWASDTSSFNCDPSSSDSVTGAACYTEKCAKKIRNHISEELDAAFHYLYLAAYFDQDSVNRPGLAKFLYESASEEREHAIMMLKYMNMRGIKPNEKYNFKKTEIEANETFGYRDTLEIALKMEIRVTEAIYKIVEKCESDYHSADVFTDPVLEEQHNGIRKLKGLIKAFDDMSYESSGPNDKELAEYLFDRKLSEGLL